MNIITRLLPVMLPLFLLQAIQTNGQTRVYGTGGEEVNCGVYISTYREFFKIELYKDAVEPWRVLFNQCPSASEQMYLDGVTMYRSFIEAAPEGPVKQALIDTLMLVYDRRIENFGGEGNVLGRKGRDLLEYRRNNIDEVSNANGMLRRSVELEGKEAQEAVMLLLISSGVTLYEGERLGSDQLITDYLTVKGHLDELLKRSSRWERTSSAISELMLQENILTCENLNSYFGPRYQDSMNDRDFLELVTGMYKQSGCDRADLFIAASEQLYQIDPGPVSAHNLAIVFITRNDFQKAADYLKMAVAGDGLEREVRAEWFYELAVVSNALENYCDAIEYAREAIAFKSDYGDAYILLGDAFIASRTNLGDDFEQQTAFWAAADKYSKAAEMDPEVADEARERRARYVDLFPGKEEVFFRDLKEGDPYRVGGCINEQTTVQFN